MHGLPKITSPYLTRLFLYLIPVIALIDYYHAREQANEGKTILPCMDFRKVTNVSGWATLLSVYPNPEKVIVLSFAGNEFYYTYVVYHFASCILLYRCFLLTSDMKAFQQSNYLQKVTNISGWATLLSVLPTFN